MAQAALSVKERLSGELVIRPQNRAVAGVMVERALPKAAPVVPAAAPVATLAEVDEAIAERRRRIADCDARAADLERRISAPPAGRLKMLLTGKGSEDRDSLEVELADERAERSQLVAELAELESHRAPFLATADCYQFDAELRPKLRAAIAELHRHLSAAAQVFHDNAATMAEAEALHRRSVARGIIAARQHGSDLPAPDPRELAALAFWRSTLTGDGPNTSKLARWCSELAAAGIDAPKGGRR